VGAIHPKVGRMQLLADQRKHYFKRDQKSLKETKKIVSFEEK
jgi:hypothetical protein